MSKPLARLLAVPPLFAAPLVACGGGTTPADDAPPSAEQVADEVAVLRAHVDELMARPEHDADRIEVQHLLVGYPKSPKTGQVRTLQEAEELTAILFARARAGADFDDLVREHTDDAHPGIYTMTAEGASDFARGVYARKDMVPAFGDVGWRLEPGEMGVAPPDPDRSPYGYHIVERLQ